MRASEREQRRERRVGIASGLEQLNGIARTAMTRNEIKEWVAGLPREVLEAIVLEAALQAAGKGTTL